MISINTVLVQCFLFAHHCLSVCCPGVHDHIILTIAGASAASSDAHQSGGRLCGGSDRRLLSGGR